MKIIKGGSGGKELVCTAEELKAVNAFAKAELSAEDVYIFSVLLCDNEIDRDHERFSEATLRELGELFVGVTGICDHDWRSDNQVARIYRTELVTDKNRKNSLGADYVYLKGYAYMLRTEANAELIAQIDGGIKRETSVGCSVARSVCSVCGEELGTCTHVKGRNLRWQGVLCDTRRRSRRLRVELCRRACPAWRRSYQKLCRDRRGQALCPRIRKTRKGSQARRKVP